MEPNKTTISNNVPLEVEIFLYEGEFKNVIKDILTEFKMSPQEEKSLTYFVEEFLLENMA